jgi:hypothetical protein
LPITRLKVPFSFPERAKEGVMPTVRRVAIPAVVLCVLAVLLGCPAAPTPEKIEAINNSDVYKLAHDALQPIVDQFVEGKDRILLANMPAFDGCDTWRFVPTPLEVKQEDFEKIIRPNAQKLFKPPASNPTGPVLETKLLSDLFTLDSAKKVYTLKTTSDKYNELLLGRTLAGAGYSGLGSFSLADFVKANPYFIDSFESGLLSAVLPKGMGFERLWTAGMDRKDVPRSAWKQMVDQVEGKLVFNTNMLNFNTWADIQKAYEPNKITKLLMYSINNVVFSRMDYIGMSISFRLIDVARGGKFLWSKTMSLKSDKFPKDKVPFLGAVQLTIPPQAVGAQRDGFVRTLKDQGVRSMSAVLMKIDDIPIFGSYPVTREDFAVENALEGFFQSFQLSAGQTVNIVEKLSPRMYKQPWQLAHAVHYINPLLGGDYDQFRNYYGAQYMIGYRVLWKKFQGVQLLQGDKDLELSGKILGIYVKIMDMADKGRVVLSDFLTLGTDAELDGNRLYLCYARTKSFSALAQALRDKRVITDTTRTALINRRMEIANNYIGEKTTSEDFILNRIPRFTDDPKKTAEENAKASSDYARDLLMTSYDVYEVLRIFGQADETSGAAVKKKPASGKEGEEEKWTEAQERNLTMAVNLMQSWFEDGLCTALVAGDAAPNEKMESLYSRYLILKSVGLFSQEMVSPPEEMLYLSPLLISRWISLPPTPPVVSAPPAAPGAPPAPAAPAAPITSLKAYYGIDKIIYFSLLETSVPTTAHITPPASSPIARFFPLVAADPDSLQVSVVNLNTGDYEYKNDFALK